MTTRFSTLAITLIALAASAPPVEAVVFNPQEIGLIVDNFLVDTDASVIGLIDRQAGGTHGTTTFTNRSTYAGQPDNAKVTEPLATRVEWEVWRSRTLASMGGDSYVIDYKGFMKDTRASAADLPTYDIRWESKWYKNNPLKTTTYAEGGGTFKFTDPDFDFDITVDPLNPSNVTISGSAGVTLWGVVDLTISGEKDFSNDVLTAQVEAAANVPLISDYFGSVASAAFVFEYDQDDGTYESRVETQVFFELWEDEEVVNGGSVRAPAMKVADGSDLRNSPPENAEPPFTHTLDGHWAITPLRVHVPVPAVGGGGATDLEWPDPFGELSTEIGHIFPDQWNQQYQLYSHPGFIDHDTFPADMPTSSIAYSLMDPTVTTVGGPPPGITVFPTQAVVPEPSSLTLAALAVLTLACYCTLNSFRRSRSHDSA